MLPPAFGLIVRRSPLRHVIRIDGEIDVATAPALRRALAAAGVEGTDVTVDLTHTTFLDSCGLNVLLDAAGAAERSGHRLDVLCAEAGAARRLFAITHTEHLLAA
ncbi:MAG TPA: STAS domain-containing protein [Solirubrobacteraceae bacterium]|nr:STAS domain-containing protein [Solirubrobacteraceae bacterium]